MCQIKKDKKQWEVNKVAKNMLQFEEWLKQFENKELLKSKTIF